MNINLSLLRDLNTLLSKSIKKRLSQLQVPVFMRQLLKKKKVSPSVKNFQKKALKTYRLLDNTKSSQESLKDPSTPSMKEEKEKLSKLQAQESMNSRRKEHTDSLLVKDLKNEKLMISQLQVNMSLNLTLLKALSTQFTKEEKRRLRPLLVQENMNLLKRKVRDSQLGKN